MRKPLAIHLKNVSKIYKLHGSQRDQLIDVLGLHRLGFKPGIPAKEFTALDNITLEVSRGHRIGIVGRNGAGKTTLLKLLCGNFTSTQGSVEVNGTVQALLNTGLGFHPEYTGRENIEASLQYSGLKIAQYHEAIENIIGFCELGDYIDQPFKTYSLGMQARLMFASATAINPDILIVDEVLGAGDAYFIAKSKARVEKLVSSGCTMLLVSHSMQQILELCDEAIWLEHGSIRMQGEAFLVVKAYEEFMHGPIDEISAPNSIENTEVSYSESKEPVNSQQFNSRDFVERKSRTKNLSKGILFQEPAFIPHGTLPVIPDIAEPLDFNFLASGNLSRWKSESGLKFCGFTIQNESGITNILTSLKPAKFLFDIIAERDGEFACRYSINISDHQGKTVSSIRSPRDHFTIHKNEKRKIEILFNPLQLGSGEYTIGMVILGYGELELINTATRYDLLSRSFEFKVDIPDSWASFQNQFFHSAEWGFL